MFWIIGFIITGCGLAGAFFGLPGVEQRPGNALFAGGMTLISSGVVIMMLGLVMRQLGRLRSALERRTQAVSTERSSPAEPVKPTKSAVHSIDSEHSHGEVSRAMSVRPAQRDRPERNRMNARPAFAVIQSGTVNSMNYELRSDGSIFMMLPDRTLEFRSIDELRRYIAALPARDAAASRHSV